MIGKVIFTNLTLLSIWFATCSAISNPIIDCLIDELSVEIEGQTVDYHGVETYLKYDRDELKLVKLNKDDNKVSISIKNAGVIFRGDASVNPKKFNVKAERLIQTEIQGSARFGGSGNSQVLGKCVFDLKRQETSNDNLPNELSTVILKTVTNCIQKPLCEAIKNISDKDFQ